MAIQSSTGSSAPENTGSSLWSVFPAPTSTGTGTNTNNPPNPLSPSSSIPFSFLIAFIALFLFFLGCGLGTRRVAWVFWRTLGVTVGDQDRPGGRRKRRQSQRPEIWDVSPHEKGSQGSWTSMQPLASRFIRDVPPQADPQQNPSPAQASGSNIPSLPQPSLIAASRIGAVPLPYSPRLWGGRTPSHANRRRAQNTDRANPGAPVATLSPASSPPAATIVASRPLATVSISVPGPSSAATAQPPPSQSQQTPMVPRENLWRRICRRAAEHRWTQTMYEEMMFRLPPEPRRRRSDVTRRNQDLDGEAADEAGDEDKGNIIGLQVAVLIAMPNPNAPSYASWKLGCRAENDVGVDVDVEVASASSSEKGKARESFIEDVLGDLPHLPSMQRDTDGKVHEEGMGDFVIGTAEIKPWPSIATVFVEQGSRS